MKISCACLWRILALPSTYDSFSFPINKLGYSSVGTYTRATTMRLSTAEEGPRETIHPANLKPPWNAHEERISSTYPCASQVADQLFPGEDGVFPSELSLLNAEGRALTLDFGLFIPINIYCPNETPLHYKINYHLVKAGGRSSCSGT